MKGDRICYRTKRVVRRYPHLVDLCHRGDFLRLKKAPAVTEIRLNYMTGSLLKKWPKLVPADQPFTRGNRNPDLLPDFAERFDVFRWYGLFAKVRPEFGDRLNVLDCHRRIGAPIEIDHHIDFVPHRFPKLLHQPRELLHFSNPFQRLGTTKKNY